MRCYLMVFILGFSFFGPAQAASYHITTKATVTNINATFSRLTIVLPLVQTNQYQTVSNVNVVGASILDIPETDPVDKYLRWSPTTNLPSAGQQKEYYYDYAVTLFSYNFDFSQVTTIFPYDTTSNTFRWYTGSSGSYVDPQNAAIRDIGNTLWGQSAGIVDYIRRCYEYVAQNYSYINPNTGLHPLADLLSSGGGDCGNLSSIWISFVRYKRIPARHVVTVRPDGSTHVWSEFYLQNYGWIPVDVTAKQANGSGDYFGKYDGNGIVMNRDAYFPLQLGNGSTYDCPLLQTFGWWYWGSGTAQASYAISSSPIAVPVAPTVVAVRHTREVDRLNVYDVRGRLVSGLNRSRLSPGYYFSTTNSGEERDNIVHGCRPFLKMAQRQKE